jgi:hypothetical protein
MLIRFKIITRFIKLIKNPLYTKSYNLKKADWPRFCNRLKQFATPRFNALLQSKFINQ